MAARIHEITTFGGQALILGRTRTFMFDRGALTIEGLSFDEVQGVLGRLAAGALEQPDTIEELFRAPTPEGHTPVRKPGAPAPAPERSAPRPKPEETAEKPVIPAAPEPSSAPRPQPAAAPAPEAAEETAPAKRRGRPPKEQPAPPPAAEEPKNGRNAKLDALLNRVNPIAAPAPADKVNGTPVAEEPALPDESPDNVAETQSPDASGPQTSSAPEPQDTEASEPEVTEAPAPAARSADSKNPAEQKAEPAARSADAKPLSAQKLEPAPVTAAEKRAERKEKEGPRTLVDDAEEEVRPRAAAGKGGPRSNEANAARPDGGAYAAAQEKAQAAKTAAGPKPTNGASAANGTGSFVLNPDNLPREIYEAKSMRAACSYLVQRGVTTIEGIHAEFERIKDKIPMFRTVADLRARVEAALELVDVRPAQTTKALA